jgi:deoxyribodipyrimidine photo-lyase
VSRAALLLHHAPAATRAMLAQEAAAAEAFEREALALGLEPSVSGVWGATLYHPDDLPYSAFCGSGVSRAALAGGGGATQRRLPQQQQPQQQQHKEEEGGGGGGGSNACGPPPNAETGRYRQLPPVMTDFRRAVQALSAVRPPLPAPSSLPPPPPMPATPLGGGGGGGGGADDLLAPLPADVLALYESAGPEAAAALRRLAALTKAPGLAPPGEPAPSHAGDAPHPASGFPFRGGEAAATARLRAFLSAEGMQAGAGSGGAGPLEGYGEARCGGGAPRDGARRNALPVQGAAQEGRCAACLLTMLPSSPSPMSTG